MKHQDIDSGNAFDWGRTSKAYAKYRDIYPEVFYQRIVDAGLCTKGQKVLDLGTGTGVLPRNLFRFGADFTGADISENQIAEAKRLSQAAGIEIAYIVASAESMDFPPESFDVITACQCFLYFDKEIALPKIHSMLKDGGHFCVLWVAWLPFEDEIAGASERLVLKYNPVWNGAGYQRPVMETPQWLGELFSVHNMVSYDLPILFTRETWHGRMLACRGTGASHLPEKELAAFQREHKDMLNSCPEQFNVLHHVTMLDLVKK